MVFEALGLDGTAWERSINWKEERAKNGHLWHPRLEKPGDGQSYGACANSEVGACGII